MFKLLRRRTDHGKLQRGSSSPPSNSNASLDSSGIYPQSQQECANTHSDGDFLEVLHGFMYHADLLANSLPTPRIQSVQLLIRETLAQGQASILKLSQLLGSMVSTHQAVLGAPLHYHLLHGESHTKTQSQLQHCSDNLRQHEPPQTQRQVDANTAVGHGDRIRCIDAGLGSESQQHQHGRTMATTREITPHQLP